MFKVHSSPKYHELFDNFFLQIGKSDRVDFNFKLLTGYIRHGGASVIEKRNRFMIFCYSTV